MDVEVLLGNVTVQIIRNSDQKLLVEYPCPMDASMHITGNVINFDLVKEGVIHSALELNQVQKETYSVRIECFS